MLSAALIEFEGVLADVAGARAAALSTALAAGGVSPTGEPASWLAPFDDLARALAGGAADDTALALVALRAERDFTARVAAGVTLRPSARDAVQALGAEWRVAVVTMGRRTNAERVLALAGLDASVRFVVAADDGPPFASEGSRVARVLARLRVPGAPAGTVAALIASPAALAAARAAGARTVLVSGVFPSETTHDRADLRLTSLHGLTPARLAAALDCAPPQRPSPLPRR